MVSSAYTVFDDPEVCKVRSVGDVKVAELFHGPTLTFKDYALSLVGKMYDHFLAKRKRHMTIVVGEELIRGKVRQLCRGPSISNMSRFSLNIFS